MVLQKLFLAQILQMQKLYIVFIEKYNTQVGIIGEDQIRILVLKKLRTVKLSQMKKENLKSDLKQFLMKVFLKKILPVFTYEITADVTDINGETRSATTTVKVGYHSLLATISLDDKIDKNQKETSLKIDTKNLNGEFIAAKGIIKIYKLKAPKNPLRKRPWSAPDYQDISENEFRNYFQMTLFLMMKLMRKTGKKENWFLVKSLIQKHPKKYFLEILKIGFQENI